MQAICFLIFPIYLIVAQSNRHIIKVPFQSEHKKIQHDSIAVLPIDTSESMFDNSTSMQLSETDMKEVEKLLNLCIENNNQNVDSTYSWTRKFIELAAYNRQYIAYFKNGERFVFVNCFHKVLTPIFKNWKSHLVSADGGGNYFFNVTINLSTHSFYDFWINAPI